MRFSAPLAWSLLGLAACDPLLGIQQLPHASPDGGGADVVDTGPPPNAACVACVQASCASEQSRCEGEPTCSALWRCLRLCNVDDPMCRKGCEDQSPAWVGSDAYVQLDRCRRKSCLASCFGTGGWLGAMDGRCGCADAACVPAGIDCLQSGLADASSIAGACDRDMACIAAHPNPDGYIACRNQIGANADPASLLDCARGAPCGDCPISTGELVCMPRPVGNGFQYAPDRLGSRTVKIEVRQLPVPAGQGADLAGAQGTACDPCLPCNPLGPTAAQTTTDNRVSLVVPTTNGSFSGCFKIEPPAARSGDFFTTYVFPGRPIDQDEDLIATDLVSTAGGYVDIFAAAAGTTADYATHGHVIGSVHDCIWRYVANAKITVDAPSPASDPYPTKVIYFFRSDLASDQSHTSADGTFAILNVPAGAHTITATLPDGTVVGTLAVEIPVGQMIDANLFPPSISQ